MLLGKYSISDHVIEQYDKRVENKRCDDIIKCIKADLRSLNIKKIVYAKNVIYVFTKGYKEFIFEKERGRLLLTTMIKRNRVDTEYTIKKRQRLVTN